jgi:hypothetical protein
MEQRCLLLSPIRLLVQRRHASCPGSGARRRWLPLLPAGQPLREITATTTGTADWSRAAAARPPRRGSTIQAAWRTAAGRPHTPPPPGTRRRGGAPAPGRGRVTTRRSGAWSASPSARAGGNEAAKPRGHLKKCGFEPEPAFCSSPQQCWLRSAAACFCQTN